MAAAAAAAAAVPAIPLPPPGLPPVLQIQQVQKLRHGLPPNPVLPPNAALNGYGSANVYAITELAIINQNVSQLVELIKRKLGDSNRNVNLKVAGIVNNINRAMNQINTQHMPYLEGKIIDRNPGTDDAQVKDTINLNNLQLGLMPNFGVLQNYTRGKDSQQYVNTVNANEAIVSVQDPVNQGNLITIDMTDLQNDNGSTLNAEYDAAPLNLTNVADLHRVQNQLNNCQRLEMLYLIKHEELMKTFTFTLNLFDKYQYSTKLLLFVLKNLVYKNINGIPPHVPPAVNIQLPKPLIRNIKELLKDQQKMQDVIKDMRTLINTNDIRDISSPTSTSPSSQELAAGPPGGTLMDVGKPP